MRCESSLVEHLIHTWATLGSRPQKDATRGLRNSVCSPVLCAPPSFAISPAIPSSVAASRHSVPASLASVAALSASAPAQILESPTRPLRSPGSFAEIPGGAWGSLALACQGRHGG